MEYEELFLESENMNQHENNVDEAQINQQQHSISPSATAAKTFNIAEGSPITASTWTTSPETAFYRITTCFLILIIGFFLAWLLPKLLKWFLRDVCKVQTVLSESEFNARLKLLEIIHLGPQSYSPSSTLPPHEHRTTDPVDALHRLVTGDHTIQNPPFTATLNFNPSDNNSKQKHHYLQKNTTAPNHRNRDATDLHWSNPAHLFIIPDRFAAYRNGKYLRSNLLILLYTFLHIIIVISTITVALWCIDVDLFTLLASLGFATFIALFHLGDFFAFIWIILTNKIEQGDIIGIPSIGLIGCVEDIELMHTNVRCITPTTQGMHREIFITHVPNSVITRSPLRLYHSWQ